MENTEIIKAQGVRFRFDEHGAIFINAEDAARGLGFTRIAASGNEVVRWERVNSYLREFGFMPTCGHDVKVGSYIPENIFYRLAMKANNEAANEFQARVANEILPSVRKDGVYLTPRAAEKILFNPDFIIKLAQQVKDAQAERDAALAQVAELKPDAEYCRNVLQSKGGMPVTVIAKDYGMSGMMFNELATVQTLWTQKGRNFLYNELKRHGVLPLSERKSPQTNLFEEAQS